MTLEGVCLFRWALRYSTCEAAVRGRASAPSVHAAAAEARRRRLGVAALLYRREAAVEAHAIAAEHAGQTL